MPEILTPEERPLRSTTPSQRPDSVYTDQQYWSSVRDDVTKTLQDLDDQADEPLPPGEQEYRTLLRRWLENHGDTDPQTPHPPEGDPNDQPFPIPDDVNPEEDFRPWLAASESPEDVDPEADLVSQPREPFDTDLKEGETAWGVLPGDVIKNDLTTLGQEFLLAVREERECLHDPERMQRRREELAAYFVRSYGMRGCMLLPFLEFADRMAKNQAELEELAEKDEKS